MRINPIQQNQNTSFKAKLQLTGNASLLKKEQTQALRTIVDKLGSKTDIIDITLSENLINKGGIPLVTFANHKFSLFLGELKNNDVFTGVVNALEQTKEIFPSIATVINSALIAENLIDEKNNNENLKMIETKVNEFMDYFKNRYTCDVNDRFILTTMRNTIQNDNILHNEYVGRMQQKTYFWWSPPTDPEECTGTLIKEKYTGNDIKDSRVEEAVHTRNREWFNDSARTIYEMLQDEDLKRKIIQTTSQNLSKNKVLENLNIEELERYYKKLNKKFVDFYNLTKRGCLPEQYIILEHPITDYVWNSLPRGSYWSKQLEQSKKRYGHYRLDKLQKAHAVADTLDKPLFRIHILSQLILNSSSQMSSEKQKEILDKISQSTIRENTKEEIDKCNNVDAYDYFYKS